MKKDTEKIGNGFIEGACEEIGVKRGVYYTALRNKKLGKPLSYKQTKVMNKYQELIQKAKEVNVD